MRVIVVHYMLRCGELELPTPAVLYPANQVPRDFAPMVAASKVASPPPSELTPFGYALSGALGGVFSNASVCPSTVLTQVFGTYICVLQRRVPS